MSGQRSLEGRSPRPAAPPVGCAGRTASWVPYHYTRFADGNYTFEEHSSVETAHASVDFVRANYRAVENKIVWGHPGHSRQGNVLDDAMKSHPCGQPFVGRAIWTFLLIVAIVTTLVIMYLR